LFELKGDITPGGTVDAYRRLSVDSSGNPVSDWTTLIDSSRTVKVRDINGCLRAWGRDTVTGYNSVGHGAYCIAQHDDYFGSDTEAQDVWLIASIQEQSSRIKVAISGSLVSAGSTFTPVSLAVMDRGQDPSFNGGHYPTIQNYDLDLPASSTEIICLWDESISKYLVIDGPCPS
jgi:hypothetical protein